MDFIVPSTIDTAKALLGVKVIYNDDGQIYSGYIVETEAYLGFDDRAAHGFGGKQTPKVTSLYQRGGTIYGHIMHTHLLINFVTQQAGVPEGVLIRAIEPVDGIEAMKINRGKYGYELTNGPGKWTKAFHIPRAIDGTLLNVGRLSIDTKIVNIHVKLKQVHELEYLTKVYGHQNLYVIQLKVIHMFREYLKRICVQR